METLVRYGPPHRMDHAPQGTLCKTINSMSDEFDIYVQQSTDESNPQWELVGSFSPETEILIPAEVAKIIN